MIYFSFTCLCVFVCGCVHVSVGALRSQGAHTTAGAVPQPFILVLMIITGSQLLHSKDTILNAGTSELLPVKLLSKRRAVCGGLLAGRVAWGCSVCHRDTARLRTFLFLRGSYSNWQCRCTEWMVKLSQVYCVLTVASEA